MSQYYLTASINFEFHLVHIRRTLIYFSVLVHADFPSFYVW